MLGDSSTRGAKPDVSRCKIVAINLIALPGFSTRSSKFHKIVDNFFHISVLKHTFWVHIGIASC